MIRIGVDLGGTKIEAIAMDPAGAELLRRRVPTPRGDYAGTVDAIASLVEGFELELGKRSPALGVGTPGAISAESGRIKNSNSTWLIGMPLDQDLSRRLSRPVKIANDANCFAISEATDGAAAGVGLVFGAILGTGVGGGIVVSGRALEGANRIAGEWGHNPLPWAGPSESPGRDCYCGRKGCIETFLSGPGFSADHIRATGRSLPAEQIAGDASPEARSSLARYCDRLARALASVINVLDPEVIVLGGGMSNV
ncbi:MAG TPA: ROK family protein, partial [Bdellovibrionota bacterium]|nr:ROK family protein [Bdellovibrionota bacterium]